MTSAIIPIRDRTGGKTRLASILNKKQRADFIENSFCHVVSTLTSLKSISTVFVLSKDQSLLSLATSLSAEPIEEPAACDNLNQALESAASLHLSKGNVMIIHADLPLLTAEDVDYFIAMHQQNMVTLAPCHYYQGTNAMILPKNSPMRLGFGEHSLKKHSLNAHQAQLKPRIMSLPSIAFDVDTPDDFYRWKKINTSQNR